jgi:hypothetical protein
MRTPVLLGVLALLAATPALAQQTHTAPSEPVVGRKPTHMPYVQAGTTTTMTVMWRGPRAATPTLVVQTADRKPLFEVPGPVGDVHTFKLTTLKPGTTYVYEARENGQRIGGGEFHTNPGPAATRYRFAVMGDSGSGSANQYSVAKRLTKWAPEFVLHMGDVVYEKGELEQYGPRYMDPFHALVANTVVYPTPGNHDYGMGNLNGYTSFFEVPRAQMRDQERWYTFTYGNAQFFSLDTNLPFDKGTPQYNWLVAQLAASKAPWKFAYFHHPMYSSGEHGSSLYLRQAWGPLFERHNVQLVFAGHDHHFERSKPREDFVRDGVPTTYYVTGGAGAWLRGVKQQPFTAITQSAYHFLGVQVTDRELSVDAIDKGGFVIDRFKLTR